MTRPVKLERYSGEQKDSDLTLGWTSEFKYNFLTFPSRDQIKIVAEGAPLPDKLLKVVATFLREVNSKWEVSWNADTPGLQYSNRGVQMEEKLPRENFFHCQLESGYCTELCETRTKEKAHEMLLGDQPLEWWEKFGMVQQSRKMIRPQVIKEKETKMGKKARTIFTLRDSEGYSTVISFQVSVEEARKLINFDQLDGSKEISYQVLPTLQPIRTSTQVSIGQLKRDALEYLSRFYKIRLQVKPCYQVWTTQMLLHLFETEEVGYYVTDLKVSLVYASILKRGPEERLASLVIYLQPGQVCFEKVLSRLQLLFQGVEQTVGLDLPSRYNLRVNEMLYYSQGDGDTKAYFQKKGVLSKFFDATTNHATFLTEPSW